MAQMEASRTHEFELQQPPSDGISRVRFVRDSHLLLTSSWDGGVRLYDAAQNQLKDQYSHKAAVLDVTSAGRSHAFSAGMDRRVVMHDWTTQTESIFGTHEKAVRCLEYSEPQGLLFSGSWDSTVQVWDVSARQCVQSIALPDKAYTMDVSASRLIVGCADRQIWVWDLRNLNAPSEKRQSSLKFQTRCVKLFPDDTGYATASIEGRVAIDYFSAEQQDRKYAFKCHRATIDGVHTVWPVNCIAFHPIGTFATGGCDGYVNVWDGQNKKRLCQFHKYPTSIASLDFSSDGQYLAIASSYTFEEGERDHPLDQVFVRQVAEAEVKPKARGQ
ncbi:WD domain, Gbeta repeat-containing protein [Acanthamoeba castellanii str. Neff]|uniref:WD domain, Gbeta repeat-containing protein n=1 Tax=Acanthamoeba castellanii (strain ATCC 30010 / Neff) TaxID=1257118 RepID=L8HJV5_ACACF|nr:WD domain, Gbeta repeat-containing protein [Acanthamoeba castellanii str. Neff]ELR24656.1 WD domain, Gbeta repeat-containing protein [Acanthamoeba castellanii str. Neff]